MAGMSSDPLYVVAGPEYWDSLPQTRQLKCGRVRFTSCRADLTKGACTYATKQEAVTAALASNLQLVRELCYGSGWQYQLLLEGRTDGRFQDSGHA